MSRASTRARFVAVARSDAARKAAAPSAAARRAAARSAAAVAVAAEPLESRAYLSAAFTPQPTVALPAPPTGFAYQRPVVGDFDGDGKADVALSVLNTATQGQTGSFYVAKGNGDGTFGAPGPATAVVSNYEPAAGDLDGDGDLDLVFSDFGANVLHVFRNNGDGTFAAAQDFSAGAGAFQVRAADFNKDGLADVAVVNGGATTVTVRLGSASTTLGPATTLTAGTAPVGLAVGDFDGDGDLDIVVGNRDSNDLSAFAGNGAGTFAAKVTTAGQNTPVDAADLNADGRADLFRGFDNSYTPFVSLSNGDLTFATGTAPDATLNGKLGDVDGDGVADVVASGLPNGALVQAYGNGDGTFGGPIAAPIGNAVGATEGFGTIGDVNGDGLLDPVYVVAPGGANQLFVALSSPAPRANLVPSAAAPPPAAVVGGAAGKLSVTVTNAGTLAFKGPVTVRLVASADGAVDGADAEVVSQSFKLSLKPGKAKAVKFKFAYPAGLTDGEYVILAQVDPTGAVDQPRADDVASTGRVTIAAPFVDLAAAFPSPLSAGGYRAGKKVKIPVRLTNLGNVLATGTATVTLTSSADATVDAGDVTLGSAVAKVKLKPTAGKAYKVTFTIPAGFAAGSTTLIATVASALNLTDVANLNDTAVAAEPFVVTAG